MATGTPAQILAIICPKLGASPLVDDYVAMASTLCSPGYFGLNWARAVALRAAHDFTLDVRNLGESGAIVSKTEGRLSLSFSHGGKTIDDLDQTGYGVRLKELIRISGVGVSSTFSDVDQVDSYLIQQDKQGRQR